jgi:hypothetical protein
MKKVLFINREMTLELENGIMISTFNLGSLDLKTTQKIVEDRVKIMDGKLYPLVADIRSVKYSTKAARDFFASEKGCEGIIAAALLVNGSLGSMIGNFFAKISKPFVPTKVFSNEIEAKKWLAQYVK